MSTVVRRFIDATASLPRDLAQRSDELRELDERVESVTRRIEKNHAAIMRSAIQRTGKRGGERPHKRARPSPSAKTAGLEEQLKEDMATVQRLAKEKLLCASAMYEAIDKLIQKADKSLNTLQADIGKERERLGLPNPASQQLLTPIHPFAKDVRGKTGAQSVSKSGSVRREKKGRNKTPVQSPVSTVPTVHTPVTPIQDVASGAVGTPLELGLVDLAEPRYCLCNMVSHGEMIGCDNPECPIEWFHFDCVGISKGNRPKGKWYCQQCAPLMKKGGRAKQE